MNLYRLFRAKPYLNHGTFSSIFRSFVTNNPTTPKPHLQIENYSHPHSYLFSEDSSADEITEVYLRTTEAGINLSPYVYTTLIKSLTKEGRRTDFLLAAQVCTKCIQNCWFQEFFKSNPIVMDTLLHGLGLSSYVEFKKLVVALKNQGLQPNDFHYEQMIENLCHYGKSEEAIKYFDMLSSTGMKFRSNTYQVLFRGLNDEKKNLLFLIQRLYKDACEKNVQLQGECFETLIEVLIENQDFRGVLCVWKDYTTNKSPKKKLQHFCSQVLKDLCKVWKVDEAKTLFEWMLSENMTPDEYVMQKLILLYCSYTYGEEVRRIFRLILEKNLYDGDIYSSRGWDLVILYVLDLIEEIRDSKTVLHVLQFQMTGKESEDIPTLRKIISSFSGLPDV